MLATAAGLAVVAAVGWFAVEPVVQFVMPQYVGAVPAMQWALLLRGEQLSAGDVRLRRGPPAGMYLVALGCGIAAYIAALALLGPDADLTAFPQAMLVGRTLFLIVGYLLVLRLPSPRRGW